MHSRLIAVAVIAATLIVLSSISLSFAGQAHAAGNCPATYTVQYGDTLYSIARRFNSSVWELMTLNRGRIWNPHYIFAGQRLCVPYYPSPTPPPMEPDSNSQVAIESAFRYNPNTAESEWTLMARGGQIGKRTVYPLQSVNAIDTVSNTQVMRTGIFTEPRPILIGFRNNDQENTYTLVTVDREDILSSLRITGTLPARVGLCPIPFDVKDALGDQTVTDVEVTLWLEGKGGLRYPFSITSVDNLPVLPDIDVLERCYGNREPGFALFVSDSGEPDEYRILMVLSQEGFGPPGRGWPSRCRSWYGGWFYGWLRAWYGC